MRQINYHCFKSLQQSAILMVEEEVCTGSCSWLRVFSCLGVSFVSCDVRYSVHQSLGAHSFADQLNKGSTAESGDRVIVERNAEAKQKGAETSDQFFLCHVADDCSQVGDGAGGGQEVADGRCTVRQPLRQQLQQTQATLGLGALLQQNKALV